MVSFQYELIPQYSWFSSYFSCLILSCSCPVSQIWNIFFDRFVSLGPLKSVTSLGYFNLLNSVCFYNHRDGQASQKPETHSNQAFNPITLSKPIPSRNTDLCICRINGQFLAQSVLPPTNPSSPLTHSLPSLSFQEPTVLVFRLGCLLLSDPFCLFYL